MGGRLASPRFRRRAAWSALLLGVPVALAVVALEVGNTGKSTETPLVDKPAWVYHQPKVHRVTPRNVIAVLTRCIAMPPATIAAAIRSAGHRPM